ncbi:MAG: pyrroloquinoline quinone biosynthesis protein PqqE [Candidatus Eremiobacteraeota bacterium]|nr:pyrroloquinoline quinone biosynthesis protein PqqE [Candidatus Eremiobacteraeota bacterium]
MEYQPLSLLAELTYRCNLQCPYCYNPLDLGAYRDELDAATWSRVIDEAAELGVLQLHLSGGEPTLRADDCCTLVKRARERELYTNLITQGTFLSDDLLDRLLGAGLDHIQISLQAADAQVADVIAGTRVHERKLDALQRALQRNVAVTLNCVLHSHNIDDVTALIALAERLGVRRLELANTQFYGWAFRNRGALMPTRAQVERAAAVVHDARQRLAGRMEITHVLADYYEEFPKPCMSGWGRQFMTVTPDGRVLPCPAAAAITTLRFENVRDKPLAEIWQRSNAFNAYRGTNWMPQPCRSCDRREIDWGGCRCQAFLLTGDAGVTDPACSLSPQHSLITDALAGDRHKELVPRRF